MKNYGHVIDFNTQQIDNQVMSDLKSIRRELAGQLKNHLDREEVKDIIRKHDNDDLLPARASLENLIAEHIRVPYDEKKRIKILESYLQNTYLTNEGQYDRIFNETEYYVRCDGDNVQVAKKGREKSNKLNQDHKSYIERKANQEVIEEIEQAEGEFAKKNYGNACTHLRHALEAMTAEDYSYHEGLDELASKGIIQQDNDNTRDHEALYLAYGYNSDVGSHKHLGKYSSYQQQAEFSMVVVIETIYFLLQIINEAEDSGKKIENWNV